MQPKKSKEWWPIGTYRALRSTSGIRAWSHVWRVNSHCGWMAKAWGVAKSTNRNGRLSSTKLICYQKYLATKIKFVGIKYWRLLGQILFFCNKNSYFCRWNISLENTFSDNFISSRKTLGNKIRFLSRNF